MTDNVLLNADRTAVVPPTHPGKKWQISRKDAVKLGLLESDEKPVQERRFDASKAVTPQTNQRRRNPAKQGQDRGRNQDA